MNVRNIAVLVTDSLNLDPPYLSDGEWMFRNKYDGLCGISRFPGHDYDGQYFVWGTIYPTQKIIALDSELPDIVEKLTTFFRSA